MAGAEKVSDTAVPPTASGIRHEMSIRGGRPGSAQLLITPHPVASPRPWALYGAGIGVIGCHAAVHQICLEWIGAPGSCTDLRKPPQIHVSATAKMVMAIKEIDNPANARVAIRFAA